MKRLLASLCRMLSVCSRVWISDAGAGQSRGVVEMHTYILVNGHWTDVTSLSITVNFLAGRSRQSHFVKEGDNSFPDKLPLCFTY